MIFDVIYLPFFVSIIRQWEIEPDNLGGQEHCAMMYNSGVFSDKSCDTLANYVCTTSQIGITMNNRCTDTSQWHENATRKYIKKSTDQHLVYRNKARI